MEVNYVERLLHVLKAHGVSHFKSNDLELRMDAGVSVTPSTPPPEPKVLGDVLPSQEEGIPHHVNEVAGLLKLSDADLVDKLFPIENPEGNI